MENVDLATIATRTKGMTGADIKELVRRVGIAALNRSDLDQKVCSAIGGHVEENDLSILPWNTQLTIETRDFEEILPDA